MAPTLRPLQPPPRKESSRPSRSACARVHTYREDSSDADSDRLALRPRSRESVSDNVHVDFPTSVSSPTKSQPPKVTRASSGSAKRTLFSQASRAAQHGSPSKKRKVVDADRDDQTFVVDTETIPPWQTLPYHILLEAFCHAAPLRTWDPAADVSKSAKWLLAVSRLSHSFFEPAMTAFYYAPPINSNAKLSGLIQLLEQDPSGLMTNYRNKIKGITIHSGLAQSRHTELLRLVTLTPQLKDLQIYDPTEYGQTKRVFSSSSLDDLVAVLDKGGCRLHSWEWNKMHVTRNIRAVHLRPSFCTLRSLRLHNLGYSLDFEDIPAGNSAPDVSNQNREYSPSEDLTFALSALPDLRQLEFQNCCIPGLTFLLSLPSNLQALAFISCSALTSPNLERFLATHGQHLRELVLAHNRRLNMSFTGNLMTSCPILEVFKMDFNFSSPTLFSYDAAPHFDVLLCDSEVPSWPTSLRMLQLERLRNWDVETAERVFNDLVESAPRLVNLRTLILTAILNVNWRDRARLRGQWMEKLERTFLRKAAPPDPNRRSLRTEPSYDFDGDLPDTTVCPVVVKPSPASVHKRHSSRLAEKDSARTQEDILASHPSGKPTEPSTGEAGNLSPDEPLQGMCDTVEIRIDNLRPADVLLTADNFQDEEISGDEDWNGEDMEMDEGYAW